MMGVGHALSGAAVGTEVAALAGQGVPACILAGVVTAGFALLPDLDCDGATAYDVAGPVSAAVGESLQSLSGFAYRHTATSRDRARGREGQHRHLLHTPAFAGVAGLLLTFACMAAGPWPVAATLIVGVALAHRALDRRRVKIRPPRRASTLYRRTAEAVQFALNNPAAVLGVTAFAAIAAATRNPVAVLAAVAPLCGLAVALGCLVHIAGDWLTYSGVPLLWPLRWKGEAWFRFKSPVPFKAGGKFERVAVWPLLVCGCVAAVPGLAPALVDAAGTAFSTAVDAVVELAARIGR